MGKINLQCKRGREGEKKQHQICSPTPPPSSSFLSFVECHDLIFQHSHESPGKVAEAESGWTRFSRSNVWTECFVRAESNPSPSSNYLRCLQQQQQLSRDCSHCHCTTTLRRKTNCRCIKTNTILSQGWQGKKKSLLDYFASAVDLFLCISGFVVQAPRYSS